MYYPPMRGRGIQADQWRGDTGGQGQVRGQQSLQATGIDRYSALPIRYYVLYDRTADA
jgi:hypothetical protein